MRKKNILGLLLGAVLLTACAPQASAPQEEFSGPPMDGCTVVDVAPVPNPTIQALIPAVSESDHILGAKEARVTFIEYSDYQ